MNKILSNVKGMFSDWLASTKSKRLVAAIVTSVFTTIGVETGWLSEAQALNLSLIHI